MVSEESGWEKELNSFRAAKDTNSIHLLFCIDMLNEGIHGDDITGIILLRPTESPIVFYQQIGRCLQIGHPRVVPMRRSVVMLVSFRDFGWRSKEGENASFSLKWN